jgi:hypothetical protein
MMPRMSAKEPAHPIEKRDLLQAEVPPAARIDAIAAKMASEGRFPEAIDYVEITHNQDLVAKAESDAVARGSTWLLQQVDRIRGQASPPERWLALAEAAKRAERWLDAVRALQFAGDEAGAEALRLEKCPDYEPFKPLGK